MLPYDCRFLGVKEERLNKECSVGLDLDEEDYHREERPVKRQKQDHQTSSCCVTTPQSQMIGCFPCLPTPQTPISKDPALQPYLAAFHCYYCRQPYYCKVYENPWYVVPKHVCPYCTKEQIPTFDINLPINARELDPNVEYFYNQIKDDEFIDLSQVDDCEDFALEMSEPVFYLVFQEHLSDHNNTASSSSTHHHQVHGGDDLSTTASTEDGVLVEDDRVKRSNVQNLASNVDLRLLALVLHAVRCDTWQHSSAKETSLCRNMKILLLHIVNCKSLDCMFPHCTACRSVLSYLSNFPSETILKGGWRGNKKTKAAKKTKPTPTANN